VVSSAIWADISRPCAGSRQVGLEGLVGRLLDARQQALEVAHAVAAQAAVQAGAGDGRAEELTGDRQQVVQGQQQVPAQVDDDGFLGRVRLVCRRCAVWERSWNSVRDFHLRMVISVTL